jgi:hypothetical protein
MCLLGLGFSSTNMVRAASFVALIFLLGNSLSVPARAAQEGQERVSKPDELQPDPKKTAPSKAPAMNPERKPAPTLVKGKAVRMEDALKTPTRALEGKRQPKLEPEKAENPTKGKGPQEIKKSEAPPAGTHLQLLVRLSAGGGAEVVSAKDVPGPAPDSSGFPGQWLYAVSSGDKTLATRGIPDPFEMRSFAPPEGSPIEGQGHHIEQAKTALVQVAVPAVRLSSPEIDRLSLQFYKIKAGPPVFHVDPEIFQKLKREERLELQNRVPATSLSRQIRSKATKRQTPE